MAELKTKATSASVEDFIKSVASEEQRDDARVILRMIQEITGEKPKMWGPSIIGFGNFHYKYASGHEGDMCLAGFSPRKGTTVIYFNAGLDQRFLDQRFAVQIKRLGKVTASKGCLYLKKLAEVDLDVLREMIAANIKYLLDMQQAAQAGATKKAIATRRASPKRKS
jgi:hypothetical protein